MAKDFIEFDRANEYVVNKDTVINHYIRYMLSRTQSMFAYTGLPDTIPASKLEMMLQTKGYVFITEVEGKLYALHGSLGGMPDVYEDCTEINVANVALNLTKTYNLENDGVLVNNDALRIGLLPILQKYGALLAENTISIRTVDIILRMCVMISASDDRTYTGAEKFINDILKGKISAIGESAFFDGVKVHSVANTQNYLLQFIELEQYLKASCFNEIGLNANYNMKRESLGSNEAAMNDDFLLPLVDNMIKERQTAIDKVNEKYGTEISIDYASAWKVTHEENVKQVAIAESITDEADTGTLDIDVVNETGIHDINTPHIQIEGEDNDTTGTSTETHTGDSPDTDEPVDTKGTETADSDSKEEPATEIEGKTDTNTDGTAEPDTDAFTEPHEEADKEATEEPDNNNADVTDSDTDEKKEGEDDDRDNS